MSIFGTIPGVAMSAGDAPAAHSLPAADSTNSPADLGEGGAPNAPARGNAPAQSQQILTPAARERARASDFTRAVTRRAEVIDAPMESADPNDPFAELVPAGSNVTRWSDPIDGEAEQAAQFAQEDAAGQQGAAGTSREQAQGQPPQLTREIVQNWKDKADLLDALMSGSDLPKEMMGIIVAYDAGSGRKNRKTVGDLVRGNLREADYTRSKQEISEIKRQYDTREIGMVQIVGAISGGDPQAFRAAMNFLPGATETFYKACMVQGYEWDAERQLSPQERQILAQNRQMQVMLQRKQMELEAAQQMRAPTEPSLNEAQAHFVNQLRQLVPLAEKKMAAMRRPFVRSSFTDMLWNPTWQVYARDRFNGDMMIDDVVEVLTSIMQQAEDHLRSTGATHEPRAAREVPPVSRTAAAPASQLSTQNLAAMAGAPSYGRQPERARIGDIAGINRR